MLQFLVAAELYNASDELVKKYNVPENHEGIEIRLFVDGNSPIAPPEDYDLVLNPFCIMIV